jgi:glycosyltransferase involved in cell wall biosynthesis
MPVFNTEKYVKEAIESVFSQTYKNIELICIDDGSIDNSLSILKSFRDKIMLINSKDNCGTSEARNKGIRIAKGGFLAFLDADDIWENNKLEVQMNQFNINPNLDISFSYMKCFISPDISEEAKKIRYCPPDSVTGHIPSTAVIKRTSFEKVGYFDTRFKNIEFIDWINKAKEMSLKIETVNDILVFRRIHDTNVGVIDRDNSRSAYLKIIRESLDRKRKNNIPADNKSL